MAVAPAIVADRAAARERLRSRVQSLTDAQLGRDMGGGWTVAAIEARGEPWRLRRSRHGHEHLDQVDRARGASG